MPTSYFYSPFSGCTYAIKRSELFEVWSNSDPSERNEQVFQYVLSKLNLLDNDKAELKLIRQRVARFSSRVHSKWESVGHSIDRYVNFDNFM